MKPCVRCGHIRALHGNPNAYVLQVNPVCWSYVRPAPFPLRILNRVLSAFLGVLGRRS